MDTELIVDGSFGIYVPQRFAENYNMDAWHVSKEDEEALLAGPEHPDYFDVWDFVLSDAYYQDDDGAVWTLQQDGDLFAVNLTVSE